jgi:hypothetical protein
MAYLPEHGVGYAFTVNAMNGGAEAGILQLVQAFLTRDLKPPAIPLPVAGGAQAIRPYTGWYEPASPRSQFTHFLNRVIGLRRVSANRDVLRVHEVGRDPSEYVYAGGNLWRDSDSSFPEDALIPATQDGTFLVQDTSFYRRIPAWEAWLELGALGLWLALAASSIAFALYWIPAAWLRQGVRPHLSVRLLPLLAVATLLATVAIALNTGSERDTIQRLGTVSLWSMAILALTTLYPLLTLAASIQLWRARRWKLARSVFLHSLLITLLCAVVALYLGYWGQLVRRTWS